METLSESIEINGHKFGLLEHDGKPHIMGWACDGVQLPRAEDVPDGYGVIRSASASLTGLIRAGSEANAEPNS